MGDTKESLYNLERQMGGFGNELRTEALQRYAKERQSKLDKENESYRKEALGLKANEEEKGQADRLFYAYSQQPDPTSKEKWMSSLPHQERSLMEKYYGFAIPKSAHAAGIIPQGHLPGAGAGEEEGSLGSMMKEMGRPENELMMAAPELAPSVKGAQFMGQVGSDVGSEMSNVNTPIGPVNPSMMTPYLKSRLFQKGNPNMKAFQAIGQARTDPSILTGLNQ